MSLGKIMCIDISVADLEMLCEDCKEAVMKEELAELQSEQQEALVEERCTEEQGDREEINSDRVNSIAERMNEKHLPNITA